MVKESAHRKWNRNEKRLCQQKKTYIPICKSSVNEQQQLTNKQINEKKKKYSIRSEKGMWIQLLGIAVCEYTI